MADRRRRDRGDDDDPDYDIDRSKAKAKKQQSARDGSSYPSLDATDGPRTFGSGSGGLGAGYNTVTTVSAPSGYRLAQHMTIAGSFLDFALFVADVEHLKFLLDSGEENIRYFKMLIGLLCTSLALQLIVVFLLFIVGFKKPQKTTVSTRDANTIPFDDPNRPQIEENNAKNENTVIDETLPGESTYMNHIIICLVTVIAIINVFVTVFGDRSATTMIERYKDDEARRARLALNGTTVPPL